jgi:UDP:flavonoid glycosyltransferase YjiC (YdhE family)
MSDHPTVYVTLGTSASFAAAHGERMLMVVAEALGDEDLNVIVTGPGVDQASPVPANIAVASFIPLADLLPRCQLVVSHAGSGTILAALAMGLPQILLPMGADQFRNAAAVVGAGAGRQLVASELDAVTLRTSVLEMLDDTPAASAANTINNEIAAMPDARSAISVLEQL